MTRHIIAYALIAVLVLGLAGIVATARYNSPKNRYRRDRRRRREAQANLGELADRHG